MSHSSRGSCGGWEVSAVADPVAEENAILEGDVEPSLAAFRRFRIFVRGAVGENLIGEVDVGVSEAWGVEEDSDGAVIRSGPADNPCGEGCHLLVRVRFRDTVDRPPARLDFDAVYAVLVLIRPDRRHSPLGSVLL